MKRLALPLAATFALGMTLASACGDDGGGANACEAAGQRIADKYESCGFDLTGNDGGTGGTTECTDELAMSSACSADCAEQADCLALDPMPADPTDQAYLDAVAAYSDCLMGC